MELKEIIKNLRHYNNWRRDNDSKYIMPEPKQVGLTIDAAISKLNKLLIYDVSHRTWNKNEVINQLNEFESIDEAKRWFEEYGG